MEKITGSGVEFEVFVPNGASEVSELHAPRLDTLNGKTIGELWNNSWEGPRIFAEIEKQLKKQFPTVKFVPYSDLIFGKADMETQENLDLVVKKKCDAVITGMAG